MNLVNKIAEKKRIQELERKKSNAKIAIIGTTVGVLAGSVAGVLLAPKSGKETINDIKETSVEAKKNIDKKTNETKEIVSEKILESKDRIKEYLNNRKNQKQEIILEEQPVLELPGRVEEIGYIEESKEI